MTQPKRLAIIATHPIQYYSPWFQYLAGATDLDIRGFYLWDFGIEARRDPQFRRTIQWDVPLLDGYASEFVPNASTRPGTDWLFGLWNPELVDRVRAFRPTAVLLLSYNYASIYWFLTQWRRRDAPVIFRGDSHRIAPTTGPLSALRKRFISTVFRRFDACLYVGAANRRYFEGHGIEPSRLFFAPHSVDNARFITQADDASVRASRWRLELGIPAHHRVILFAGKFESKKRPLDLLRAFLDAGLSNASLLFVGSGPQEDALRSAAAGHLNVFFAPFQNQSLMARVYASSDLYVLPSYGGGETWGLAVNEAMCLSRAVLVSTHVGCAEDLVEPYVNGLIFPAGDVAALSAALREALSDDNRLRKWGEAGRRKIEAYSYEQTTSGLLRALAAVGQNVESGHSRPTPQLRESR